MLPFLTNTEAISGSLKSQPEDFRVDEVPAYPPSGQGDHLFARIEKRNLNTRRMVEEVARALGVPPQDCGYAGMKDRHAVTTQWISLPRVAPEAALALELPDIRVIEAVPHNNKLRTGHLWGNRFVITIRNASPEAASRGQASLTALTEHGMPNYFGTQRFGRGGSNLVRARQWLIEGGRAPQKHFERKLFVSVLQSEVFNRIVAARLTAGTFARALDGDLFRKEETGGLFVSRTPEDEQPRVDSWEVSPTGPMFGTKMKEAEGVVAELERAEANAFGLTSDVVARFGRDGEGTRRALRVRPKDATTEQIEDNVVRLSFSLPKGAYATVLARELFRTDELTIEGDD